MIAQKTLSNITPYPKIIFISLFFSIGVAATDGVMACLVQPALDDIFISENRTFFLLLPFSVLTLLAPKGSFHSIQATTIRIARLRAILETYSNIYPHSLGVPVDAQKIARPKTPSYLRFFGRIV